MFTLENFGKHLFKVRTEKGITQQQIADLLEVSKSRISEIEHGKNGTTLANLVKIADFLDVSTDYLLGRTDKR